jgi:hypothetical protein
VQQGKDRKNDVVHSYGQDKHLIAKTTPTPDVDGNDDNHYTLLQVPPR